MSDICNAVLAFHTCLAPAVCVDTADHALNICALPASCSQMPLYECRYPSGSLYYLTEKQVQAHDSGVQK